MNITNTLQLKRGYFRHCAIDAVIATSLYSCLINTKPFDAWLTQVKLENEAELLVDYLVDPVSGMTLLHPELAKDVIYHAKSLKVDWNRAKVLAQLNDIKPVKLTLARVKSVDMGGTGKPEGLVKKVKRALFGG